MASISEALRQRLAALAVADSKLGIRARFENEPTRAENFSYNAESFYLDLSKTHISRELIEAYQDFAEDAKFSDYRHALFSGEKINHSEDRSVLHTLLRNPENQGIEMQADDLVIQAFEAESQLFEQYQALQQRIAARDIPLKHIIHVGIGGSALGPRLVFEALKSLNAEVNIFFVGNIDGHELVDVLCQCDPAATMVVGVSKTFTTAETLKNLDSITTWFKQSGVDKAQENLIAVTANPTQAFDYGIAKALSLIHI